MVNVLEEILSLAHRKLRELFAVLGGLEKHGVGRNEMNQELAQVKASLAEMSSTIASLTELIEKQQQGLSSPDKSQPEQKPPVYAQTAEHAQEHGEIEKWRESFNLNRECREYIDKSLEAGNIPQGFAKNLTDKFGLERAMHVIASAVQAAPDDGNYSSPVKNRAAQISIPEQRASAYRPQAQPTALNTVFSSLMQMERGHQRAQDAAQIDLLDPAIQPVVTITRSENPSLPEGKVMTLNDAHGLIAHLDDQKHRSNPDKPEPHVEVSIAFTRGGKPEKLHADFEIGKIGGGLIDHIRNTAETYQNSPERLEQMLETVAPEFRDEMRKAFAPVINEATKNIQDSIIPYFQAHCQITDFGDKAGWQFAAIQETPENFPNIEADTRFHEAAVRYVSDCRRLLNAAPGPVKLPDTPKRADFDAPALPVEPEKKPSVRDALKEKQKPAKSMPKKPRKIERKQEGPAI